MRFTLEYPSEIPDAAAGFLVPTALRNLSDQAERCGFDAIALSDHPAPSLRWRRAGGHDTLEPAVALAFIAGATRTIRLMTNLYVLPFRNPYLIAKALTSLDILSGGRLVAGVGAGYLRAEFAALGVQFEDRGALLDLRLEELVRIWTEPLTPVAGNDFAAPEPTWLQHPVQRPHPPIWIGGNSAAARRRVVRYGQGWCPVLASDTVTTTIGTQSLNSMQSFGRAVQALHRDLDAAGRDPASVDIQIEVPIIDFDSDAALQLQLQRLAELAGLGATRGIAHVAASSTTAAADYIDRFADSVLKPLSST